MMLIGMGFLIVVAAGVVVVVIVMGMSRSKREPRGFEVLPVDEKRKET